MSVNISSANNTVTVTQPNGTLVVQVATPGPQGPVGASISTGSFATTGSNTFTGNQVILNSGGDSTLDIQTLNDNPYAFRIYNNTYSTGSPVFSGFGWNDGRFSLGNETDTSIGIYTNANYYNPTLVISGSGITSIRPISASLFEGDGSGLYDLPSTRDWSTNKVYQVRKTEQLTFSGDYILESSSLYIEGSDEQVEYAPNKYFKKEGKIFIGGNLLIKDSLLQNDGEINVAGGVILIGDSQITGTGTII